MVLMADREDDIDERMRIESKANRVHADWQGHNINVKHDVIFAAAGATWLLEGPTTPDALSARIRALA